MSVGEGLGARSEIKMHMKTAQLDCMLDPAAVLSYKRSVGQSLRLRLHVYDHDASSVPQLPSCSARGLDYRAWRLAGEARTVNFFAGGGVV